jgi:hypothetical protein
MTDTTHDDLVRSKAARKLNEVHRQVCFENGNHALEVDTPYSLGADALQRIAKLEAKLATIQRTLDWTEDRAKDYRYGREMMGHKWAKAEEGRTKAIEAMKRAVFLWEQPHYGDNDTIIDHGSEAIDTLRTTLADLERTGR